MKFLPLIWAGLMRKRLRTVLTLASIVVAFLLFGLLQGVNAAFDRGVAGANLDRLYVQSRVSFTDPLPIGDLPQIEAVPGVTGVAYASWFGGYYQDAKNFVFSFAVDPERYFALYPELSMPKEQLEAFIHTRTGAVIGTALAEKYGWKIGDRIPVQSAIWTKADGSSDWSFDVVGIFANSKDPARADLLLFNHDYFDEARSFQKGTIGWYIVRIGDPHRAAEIGAAIDRLFANSPDETRTMTEKENAQSFLKQIGDINFIVNAIVGAVFFTLLFLTGNTMMQSVRERVPEFAVMKTLGFPDGGILALVLAESVALCGVAAAIGLALAAASFPALRSYIGVASLPSRVLMLGAAVAVALALLTGLPPAWRARRLQIVDALAGR